ERRHQRRLEWPGAPHIDVEARVRCGDRDVERLLRGRQRLGDGPRGGDRAVKTLRQHWTMVDGNNAVRARGGKSDFEHLVRAAARMKYRATAAIAVRVDEVADRRIEARLPQRLDHETAFPGAIRRALPVLQSAAAADAEMRTDRRDALRARLFDAQQLPPVGMA